MDMPKCGKKNMENAAFAHVCRASTSAINSGPVSQSLDCREDGGFPSSLNA
jgi:hypothetical protein